MVKVDNLDESNTQNKDLNVDHIDVLHIIKGKKSTI